MVLVVEKPSVSTSTRREYDWEKADWTLRDTDVAEAVGGATRERVRQVREALRKPPSPDKWESTVRIALKRFIQNHRDLVQGLSYREVIQLSGIKATPYIAGEIMRELDIPVRPPGCPPAHPWDKMDWRLPNSDLAKAWRIRSKHPSQTVANKRLARNKPVALWDPRRQEDISSPDRLAALRREIHKAQVHFTFLTHFTFDLASEFLDGRILVTRR